MRFLRTNTAVIVTVGPFYDKTDGVTIEGSLTITDERITLTADTDAGSAPTLILDNIAGATSGTDNDLNYITNNDAGLMQIELSAANVNRLGRMFLTITDAVTHVPVFHEFLVLPAMIYDAFILGTDVLDANATQLAGQTVTAAAGVTFPTSVASPTNITAGTIATVTNLTNAPGAGDFTATMKTSIGTAVAASAVASVTGSVGGNVTGSVGSVVGAVGSVTGAVGSVTGAVGSVTGAVGSVTGNVNGNVVGSVASVTALSAGAIDSILDDTIGDGTLTARQALRIMVAALAAKLSGAATATVTVRNVADSANVIVATCDASGNRTATVVTP
jgi:hypothetical protein